MDAHAVSHNGVRTYRLDLALLQPVGQSAQFCGESPEPAHILPFAVAARRDSGPVLLRSDINACSVEIDPLELRGKRYLMLRYHADFTAPLGTTGSGTHGGISFDT
jgi:hypothetical protein